MELPQAGHCVPAKELWWLVASPEEHRRDSEEVRPGTVRRKKQSPAVCIAAMLERRGSTVNAGNKRDKTEVRGEKS